MSTVTSSNEHLTFNADGSSKNILFQANGTQKASISSAGLFTSTTIDATVLTGTLPAISGANLTNLPVQTTDISGKLNLAGGTMTGNLSITKASASAILTSTGSGNDASVLFATPSNARGMYLDDSDSNKLKFYTGHGKGAAGKEITFDNDGNVGIGVTAPAGKMHIFEGDAGAVTPSAQADTLVVENSAEGGITIMTPDASSARIRFTSPSTESGDEGGADIFYRQNINKMKLGTIVSGGVLALHSGANNETMTLDASGNVGIGVTPETGWRSSAVGLDIGDGGAIAGYDGASGAMQILSNSYWNTSGGSGWKYKNSSYPATLLNCDGEFVFKTAGNGTADNAITWTTPLSIANAGDVTVGTGNLVIGTSGKGIDFSVTSNTSAPLASMSNELLDDYEEGSWSPYITTNGGVYTTTSRGMSGFYTKIGRQVTCHWSASITTPTGGSGAVRLNNFPFAAANANHTPTTSMQWGRTTLDGSPMYGMMGGNSSQMWFEYSNSNGNPTQMPASAMNQTTPYHNGQVTYYVD